MSGFDLHRHNHFSTFDGMGKAHELAMLAKAKGFASLGLANHGNTNGLVEHYFACKDAGIKPIMGCEAYFQPTFDKDKRSYHLCLFAKNLEGYTNLNRIMTQANAETFYRKPIVTFEMLEGNSDGLICTSACVGGFISQAIANNHPELSEKALERFQSIFGDDFYLEVQPYKLNEKGLQEKVNEGIMELSRTHKARAILTSDSHYGEKTDYPSYLKMHEIGGRDLNHIRDTYSERYMPDDGDLEERFVKMHPDYGVKCANRFMKNLDRLADSVEDGILEQIPFEIFKPDDSEDSKRKLMQEIKDGLRRLGLYNKEYLARCKEEYEVIVSHGFENYFLIVQDYVKWAKEQGIMVGPGRGSVCNCQVAYALGITTVDSIKFNLDFRRFMRLDKNKLPDIDLDFETDRRGEVIQYIVNKYPGHAVQICSYGLYKFDNLLNDLFKVCNVTTEEEKHHIKAFVKEFENEGVFDYAMLSKRAEFKMYNKEHDNILVHFNALFKQVRFIGTHAAGVAVCAFDISTYTTIQRRANMFSSSYDLNDMEKIKAIKFDILGLKTMSSIGEMEKATGREFNYSWLEDERIMEQFALGETTGIFQYESPTARAILRDIGANTFEDVMAASALNRPGPLSLKMPSHYTHNKSNQSEVESSPFWAYAKDTYATIIYQEQVMAICTELAGMSWNDADRVIKHAKSIHTTEAIMKKHAADDKELRGKFIMGCGASGIGSDEADELFENLTVYSFNKGHTVGYCLISVQEMFYKVYYPIEFWYIKMKYCTDDIIVGRFKSECVKAGNVILIPHVNYGPEFCIRKVEGSNVIVEGLSSIKNVGAIAASAIEAERIAGGRFTSLDNFLDRVPKRTVNSRVVSALKENGALEFDKSVYFSRVKKYNSTLYMKATVVVGGSKKWDKPTNLQS